MDSDRKAELAALCAKMCAEGAVLLKNSGGALPFSAGSRVSVFGRMQRDYYASGTGSGGMVHAPYQTNIYDELLNQGAAVNEELGEIYKKWVREHPYDKGDGWLEPWSREEMPVSETLAKNAAEFGGAAVVIIARTAGEDRDAENVPGSWLLTETERDMLKNVRAAFDTVCVVLNIGGIMDMKWIDEYGIDAALCVWSGGQEGGRAAAELLCGARYPSGKLADTVPKNIEDHPAYGNFGAGDEDNCEEDIYVGYRYFETFAPESVLYPFGFGLGYTEFELGKPEAERVGGSDWRDSGIAVRLTVKNIGSRPGKETVGLYFGSERTALSRPKKALAAFAKTRELMPGESEELVLTVRFRDMAAYDDTGVTGNMFCYVLDKGTYKLYCGTDVRSAEEVCGIETHSSLLSERLSALFDLDKPLKRMVNRDGAAAFETLKPRGCAPRRKKPAPLIQKADGVPDFNDVIGGKMTVEEFVSHLSGFDLACLSQGEGIGSEKTRPGCVGAVGGITDNLKKYNIPVLCLTDGPSGLRFDNGDEASLLPCGTLIACSWNTELALKLYYAEGGEIKESGVHSMLGPGVNIHRFPLCGRNFEYFSEDPHLAGEIAAAVCLGMARSGVYGTVKHFAANNREHRRNFVNARCSERALREIYLKPFETVVKRRATKLVMTAYNKINGVYCSANYDLCTRLLRGEWGYDGLVMTDWWANTCEKSDGAGQDRDKHIAAQNDLYMVNKDAETAAADIAEALRSGKLALGELQRNAVNILRVTAELAAERSGQGEI